MQFYISFQLISYLDLIILIFKLMYVLSETCFFNVLKNSHKHSNISNAAIMEPFNDS